MKSAGYKDAIVALRCGVRSLAVTASYEGDDYPLNLSRSFKIVLDTERPWVSVYGGKMTGCTEAAAEVVRRLSGYLPELSHAVGYSTLGNTEVETTAFPGLVDPVPTAVWCRDHELCCTLEDYLRRRTNIAQWVPRCGLGRNNENYEHVRAISFELAKGDTTRAESALEQYQANVVRGFDDVLSKV